MDFIQRERVEGCNSPWFQCAREVLMQNSINSYVFVKSVWLNLVELMFFKCFVSPATGKYAWVGVDELRFSI